MSASQSKANSKAKATEIVDEAEDVRITADDSDSEQDEEGAEDGVNQPSASSSSKKKKKKRSKAAKALQALNPVSGRNKIPQALVDEVLEKVKAEQGEGADGVNEETVRAALEQMKIMDVLKGKAGIGGKNRKDVGDHKFWGTQPVPQPGEEPPLADGYIEESKPRAEVRQEPYPLPKDFVWSTLNLNDPEQLQELYELLSGHYVEDDHGSFRFKYSAEFLKWALMPPGYHPEWHIGVRVASSKKLVASITGVPATLRIRENLVAVSEVNYICVHKKLRSKRLAPVLIKEVTRQCHLKGIFQAIYTAGVLLPTPVSTCRYFHRGLNLPKLVNVKFLYVPANMTLARMIRLYKTPSVPTLASSGLREMEESDLGEVAELYTRYMKRYDMSPVMRLDELQHQLLSGRGEGSKPDQFKGRRQGQVVWSYVVENPTSHKITDFFSFYFLPSTIINNPKYDILDAAYLFYYASDVAFQPGADDGALKQRLQQLVTDALSVAENSGMDVFNALTLMDNVDFLQELRFGQGDGLLNFYLYNWRTSPLAGLTATADQRAGRGIGVVML